MGDNDNGDSCDIAGIVSEREREGGGMNFIAIATNTKETVYFLFTFINYYSQ